MKEIKVIQLDKTYTPMEYWNPIEDALPKKISIPKITEPIEEEIQSNIRPVKRISIDPVISEESLSNETFNKLFSELKIRFNTSPTRYEKEDYLTLLRLLLNVKNILSDDLANEVELLESSIQATSQELNETKVDKVEGSTLLSSALSSKLESVEEGSQVNIIEHIKYNGEEVPITNKTVELENPEAMRKILSTTSYELLVALNKLDSRFLYFTYDSDEEEDDPVTPPIDEPDTPSENYNGVQGKTIIVTGLTNNNDVAIYGSVNGNIITFGLN